MPSRATSQGAALPKPPAGTASSAHPRRGGGGGAGHNTPRRWAGSAAAPRSHGRVSQREGALTAACSGTQTLTFPPSSSEGAKTGSEELGETTMLTCSSEGRRAALNTELLVICLAGVGFPDLLAGEGGAQWGQARLC